MRRHAASVFAVLVVVLAVGATCGAVTMAWAESPSISAPYGLYIPDVLLDGVVGSEWADAGEYDVRMGEYNARLLIKHDHVYFYVAMVIESGRRFPAGFEAYVVFENGDGVDYSRGDDMMSVPAWGGELLEADLTYRATYDFLPDVDFDGTCDAVGAGLYDSTTRSYVFEFRRKMLSGDACDVPLAGGSIADVIYGWASY